MTDTCHSSEDVSKRAFAFGVTLLTSGMCVILIALAAISPVTDDEPTYLLCGLALRVGDPPWDEFALWLQGPLTYWANQIFALDYWPTDPLDPAWFRGRLGMIIFPLTSSIALGLFVRHIIDRRTALFAVALFCSWPVFLGNGCVIAADSSHIGCWMLALLFTVRYVERPSLLLVVLLGVVLGAALSMKYVAMLLLPALISGLVVSFARGLRPGFLFSRHSDRALARAGDVLLSGFLCAAVAVITMWCCYLFDPPAFDLETHGVTSGIFAWITALPVGIWFCEILPSPWVRGIDAMIACGDYPVGTYLLGELAPRQVAFPLVSFVTKTPLVILALLPFGFRAHCWRPQARIFVCLAIAIPLLYTTFFQDLQAGIRHLLPSLSLIAVPAAVPLAWFWRRGTLPARGVLAFALAMITTCLVVSWPNYLVSFNSLVGNRPYLWFRLQNLDWTHFSEERRQADELRARGIACVNRVGGPRFGLVAAIGEEMSQGPAGSRMTHWLRSFQPIERHGAWFVFNITEVSFRQVMSDGVDDDRETLRLVSALATDGRIEAALDLLDTLEESGEVSKCRGSIELLLDPKRHWLGNQQLGRHDLVIADSGAGSLARAQSALAATDYKLVIELMGTERPRASGAEVAIVVGALTEIRHFRLALEELAAHEPEPEWVQRFAAAKTFLLWKQTTADAKEQIFKKLRGMSKER